MTMPKNTVKEACKEERRKSRRQWMTSFGWRSRGHKDSLESNRHYLQPDASRIRELMIVCIYLWIRGTMAVLSLNISFCVPLRMAKPAVMDNNYSALYHLFEQF